MLFEALHSIRSLLCTTTNTTPHERLFKYDRRSTTGSSLPSWLLTPGKVLFKRNVRHSKYEPFVDEVELVEANPQYAFIKLPDGNQATVSTKQLAPAGNSSDESNELNHSGTPEVVEKEEVPSIEIADVGPRRSTRERRQPDRLKYE